MSQNLRTYTVISFVGAKTQVNISLYGIHSFFLQLVSAKFIYQANAPAFLVHIKNNSAAFILDHLHCFVQLFATVAAKTSQNITCKATAMHPCQYWFIFMPRAF